jgi:hypothetical protein
MPASISSKCHYLTVADNFYQRKRYSSILSQMPGIVKCRVKNVKKTYDWTHQTIELLTQLSDVLSETIKAWEMFTYPDGDICYFLNSRFSSGSGQDRLDLSLRVIKKNFWIIKGSPAKTASPR